MKLYLTYVLFIIAFAIAGTVVITHVAPWWLITIYWFGVTINYAIDIVNQKIGKNK